MDIVFEKVKKLIPEKTCMKGRKDGEFLIVCNDDMSLSYLNETSADVYDMCNGEMTIGEIVSQMKELYDVKEEELQADMVVLIRDLQWRRLLKLMEPSAQVK